jgi:uncharacterized protein (TIGR00290 family)
MTSAPATGSARPRAFVSWSSGKDAAFALHAVRTAGELDVIGLLTTVTTNFSRVSMHGVRESVLEAQARAVGLPLLKVEIPWPCPNETYERAMAVAVARLRELNVTRMVFGDLFLEDVRAYREERLRGTGIDPVFPLWGRPTNTLALEMIDAGLDTRIVALDPRKLSREFAGRRFDRPLLDAFPREVDPCGERGEFHTCVVAGPMFSAPVPVVPGEVVERDGFVFADLALGEISRASRAP